MHYVIRSLAKVPFLPPALRRPGVGQEGEVERTERRRAAVFSKASAATSIDPMTAPDLPGE